MKGIICSLKKSKTDGKAMVAEQFLRPSQRFSRRKRIKKDEHGSSVDLTLGSSKSSHFFASSHQLSTSLAPAEISTPHVIPPEKSVTEAVEKELPDEVAEDPAFSLYSSEEALKSYILTRNTAPERGCIRYQFTNLSDAAEESRARRIPIFCVEAEVPGDEDSGELILSHPLLVEAAECLFVAVAPEASSKTEASKFTGNYSYTRVRILDDSLADIAPAVDFVPLDEASSFAQVVDAMVKGITAYQHCIPAYLQMLLDEHVGLGSPRCSQAIIGSHNAKATEIELAALNGVLATRTGFWRREKVVQITYDSKQLSFCRLVRYCLRMEDTCNVYYQSNEEKMVAKMEATRLNKETEITFFAGFVRVDIDPKSALRASPLRFVPLTDLQATKMNRMVHMDKFNEAVRLLSPRQGLIMMHAIQKNASGKHFCDVVDVPVTAAWNSLCDQGCV